MLSNVELFETVLVLETFVGGGFSCEDADQNADAYDKADYPEEREMEFINIVPALEVLVKKVAVVLTEMGFNGGGDFLDDILCSSKHSLHSHF